MRKPPLEARARLSEAAPPPGARRPAQLRGAPRAPPFIVGSGPASSQTNTSASCRRVTAPRTNGDRPRGPLRFQVG